MLRVGGRRPLYTRHLLRTWDEVEAAGGIVTRTNKNPGGLLHKHRRESSYEDLRTCKANDPSDFVGNSSPNDVSCFSNLAWIRDKEPANLLIMCMSSLGWGRETQRSLDDSCIKRSFSSSP